MSDPVTNVEIEDVLSSIRRLVSTDNRAESQQKPSFRNEPEAERLVLSPSLRVDGAAPGDGRVSEAESDIADQTPPGAKRHTAGTVWSRSREDNSLGRDFGLQEAGLTNREEGAIHPLRDSDEVGDLPKIYGSAEGIADGSDDDGTCFLTSDDILDESALRDLVADIVRQELQGVLGERITRNVRKLVRREIHRALASQELQ